MIDKRNKKLDLMSMIEEDIIDRNTEKRIALMQRGASRAPRRNRYLAVISLAAVLSVLGVLLALMLIPSFGKQVPVYQGMTISGIPNRQDVSYGNTDIQMLSTQDPSAHARSERSIEEIVRDEAKDPSGLLGFEGSDEPMYYAHPNDYIYITVHIDNPDNFEIQSFVLNGEKYSSYMFESGSDMENIILKTTVGNIEGLCEFTIDAVKYIDGTRIKEAVMQGERTLRVGVYTHTRPTVNVTDELIGIDSVSFALTSEDRLGLIELSGGKLYSVICDGANVISAIEITCGVNADIRFDGLSPDHGYTYAVIGIFDAFDGMGIIPYVLYEAEFVTEELVGFNSFEVSLYKLEFSLKWNEGENDRQIVAVTLYQGDAKIKELDVNATSVSDLASDTEYRLVIDYLHNNKKESIEKSFKTELNTSVAYKVNHYLQNAENDEFVLDHSESLTGTEKTSVAPITRQYLGFISPATQTVTIAPDGSTQVDYYYTRSIYTVKLVASASDVTEKQYKYGADISDIVPVRDGYTFGGWFTDVNLTLAFETKTVPENGVTLYSWWTEENKPSEFEFKTTASSDGKQSYSVMAYKGTDTTVVVPASVGEYRVTAIGARAFFECATLVEIALPSSIEKIENYAFADCENLKKALIPKGVVTIGGHAFADCVSLTEIQLPEGVVTIDSSAFSGCELLPAISMPNTLETIGEKAFYGCEALKELVIPDSVKSIGDSAFAGCEALTEIAIPTGISGLGYGVFADCKSLTYVKLPDGLATIGSNSFVNCKKLTTVELPASATVIGDHAFDGCLKLSGNITFSNLKYIGAYAFANCVNLIGLIDLSGANTIGEYAFDSCDGIEAIVLSGNLITIAEGTFRGCSGLKETNLRSLSSLTEIGRSAFSGCSALSDVVIPQEVVTIGERAFYQCTSLASVKIRGGVRTVGNYAFSGCLLLKSLEFQKGLLTIGDNALPENIEEVTLPNTLVRIGKNAFGNRTVKVYFIGAASDWNAVMKDPEWGSATVIFKQA